MKPLVKHTRPTIPATPGQPEIIDDEYERNGTGNLFLLFEPLAGRRKVLVTKRRTAIDDAHAIRYLVDELHPDAERIVVVQDNLNTHKAASLYEAFPPDEARRLIDKLEIHDTPKARQLAPVLNQTQWPKSNWESSNANVSLAAFRTSTP